MASFQDEKALVLRFYEDLDTATSDGLVDVYRDYTTTEYRWRGVHPFHEQESADTVVSLFWKPLRQSFRHIQRRLDVFMAGFNEVDDSQSIWVCSMGHLMGDGRGFILKVGSRRSEKIVNATAFGFIE